ncbi:MAG: bifunctional DNA primase/polymerase [Elusimicrobia bacterium]|nr:bifunctional DNA primase/polymerase [Elusimicrobiota bacterium]
MTMKVENALAYAQAGWPVFPLVPNTKVPLTRRGFKDATKDLEKIRREWARDPDPNIGVSTGQLSGLGVLDVDVKNGAKGMESLQAIMEVLPKTRTARTPSGGLHLYFRIAGPLKSRIGFLPGLDLKADGGYVAAPGSEIDGKPYEWIDPAAPIADLPAALQALLQKGQAKAKPLAEGTGAIPEGQRNDTLTSLAGSMRRRGMEHQEILAALRAVNANRCQPPLPESEVETIAASVARYPPVNSPTVAKNGSPGLPGSDGGDEPMPPGFTDDDLALEFTQQHGGNWRYVAGWGRWLHWDGACWKKDDTLRAFDLSRKICRKASANCDNSKVAAKVASAATVAAVERLARTDRTHAATTDQWDQGAWLLNTPKGCVELETGKVRSHRREDYITKITAATPEGEAETWLTFLSDITNGDLELQSYLSRLAGYCLTGVTSEHALFFLYGTGANGKSVFINTLASVLGDYATNAPMDTFMETKTEKHPTDLASLCGARLVTSIEVEKGRRWAEAKIKSLTGGDKISARFMRQDFFEYKPQFKLLIAGNHKPSMRDVDEAMRRRLHLIPFTVTIPPEKRDKALTERLLEERNGILKWAVEGCLEWQRIGLKPPASVVEATEEYFESQDALGRWMEEECVINPNYTATTEDLFYSWKAWSERCGEYTGSLQKFSEDLQKKGFARNRSSKKKGFRGLTLKGREIQGDLV